MSVSICNMPFKHRDRRT